MWLTKKVSSYNFQRTFSTKTSSPAFVFDIDGVIIKGGVVLDVGKRALQKISNNGKFQYPIVFMTNGGGVLEEEKASQLSSMFGVEIKKEMMCLAHTPVRNLASQFKDKNILLVGAPKSHKDFAREYGFNFVGIEDYSEMNQQLDPFAYPKPKKPSTLPKISSIFVFKDPGNWYQALQICTDLLISADGIPGGKRKDKGSQPIDIHFVNTDLIWSTEFAWPRFGQGAFIKCLQTLYKEISGEDLKFTVYGKPNKVAYDYSKNLLDLQAKELNKEIAKIYAIGDNPNSDIKGANDAGDMWHSILTRTGVFTGKDNDETYPAKKVVNHVEEAVDYALQQHT